MKVFEFNDKIYHARDDGLVIAIYNKTGQCELYVDILPPKIKEVLCGHLDTCDGDWCAREVEPCICPPERMFMFAGNYEEGENFDPK